MGNRRKIRKICLWLLIFLLSNAVLYVLSDSPSPTAEIAFRRKEKQNLIGPAEIVEIMDFEDNRYDHLLIGRSDHGYTFFEWNDRDPDDGVLSYQPKAKGATLFCTEYSYQDIYYGQGWLPIFAFVDTPLALSAKLTLTTTNKEGETVHYPLEAQRSEDGYFLFSWETWNLRSKDFWLVQQLITGAYNNYVLSGTATATLELYDRNGELLETYQFTK